jgi:hypothetical protein
VRTEKLEQKDDFCQFRISANSALTQLSPLDVVCSEKEFLPECRTNIKISDKITC